MENVAAMAEKLARLERFAFDVELDDISTTPLSVSSISFYWEGETEHQISLPLSDKNESVEEVIKSLAPAFCSRAEKVGHGIKRALLVFFQYGLAARGPFFDTKIASYLADPQESSPSAPNEPKTSALLRLADRLTETLKEQDLWTLAKEVEFPLVLVLAQMEQCGVPIDRERLQDVSKSVAAETSEIRGRIHECAGREFDVDSDEELEEVLFTELGIPVLSKTSRGVPSTDNDAIKELTEEHPIAPLLLDYRALVQFETTSLRSLRRALNENSERIHTSFNQTAASTGRLSSSGPNLQNVPVRGSKGRRVRRAFSARAGWTLVAADYAQIELRILASMSGDESMIDTFQKGGDIHVDTAARVYDVLPEDVSDEQRRKAKAVNYGIPYGVSAWGLSQRISGLSQKEAAGLIEQYHASYPGASAFLSELIMRASDNGYAETLYGRRRYVDGINSSDRKKRSFGKRIAVNAPIQGTQADMIKSAMVGVSRRLDSERLSSRMVLQVHDELVLEAHPKEEETVVTLVKEEMEGALALENVPVVVEIGTGKNWFAAH